MIRYGDVVRVKEGFFGGLTGVCKDMHESWMGGHMIYYTVKLDRTGIDDKPLIKGFKEEELDLLQKE